MIRLLLLFVSGGFLLMICAVPAMLRLLRPGSILGIGFNLAHSSPAHWYEVNQGAGYRMFKTGLLTILAALGLYLIPGLSASAYYLSCSIVMLGLFIHGLLKTARQLKAAQSL